MAPKSGDIDFDARDGALAIYLDPGPDGNPVDWYLLDAATEFGYVLPEVASAIRESPDPQSLNATEMSKTYYFGDGTPIMGMNLAPRPSNLAIGLPWPPTRMESTEELDARIGRGIPEELQSLAETRAQARVDARKETLGDVYTGRGGPGPQTGDKAVFLAEEIERLFPSTSQMVIDETRYESGVKSAPAPPPPPPPEEDTPDGYESFLDKDNVWKWRETPPEKKKTFKDIGALNDWAAKNDFSADEYSIARDFNTGRVYMTERDELAGVRYLSPEEARRNMPDGFRLKSQVMSDGSTVWSYERAPEPDTPDNWDDAIFKAYIDGGPELALQYDAFRDRIEAKAVTPLEAMNFAMGVATDPNSFMDVARLAMSLGAGGVSNDFMNALSIGAGEVGVGGDLSAVVSAIESGGAGAGLTPSSVAGLPTPTGDPFDISASPDIGPDVPPQIEQDQGVEAHRRTQQELINEDVVIGSVEYDAAFKRHLAAIRQEMAPSPGVPTPTDAGWPETSVEPGFGRDIEVIDEDNVPTDTLSRSRREPGAVVRAFSTMTMDEQDAWIKKHPEVAKLYGLVVGLGKAEEPTDTAVGPTTDNTLRTVTPNQSSRAHARTLIELKKDGFDIDELGISPLDNPDYREEFEKWIDVMKSSGESVDVTDASKIGSTLPGGPGPQTKESRRFGTLLGMRGLSGFTPEQVSAVQVAQDVAKNRNRNKTFTWKPDPDNPGRFMASWTPGGSGKAEDATRKVKNLSAKDEARYRKQSRTGMRSSRKTKRTETKTVATPSVVKQPPKPEQVIAGKTLSTWGDQFPTTTPTAIGVSGRGAFTKIHESTVTDPFAAQASILANIQEEKRHKIGRDKGGRGGIVVGKTGAAF